MPSRALAPLLLAVLAVACSGNEPAGKGGAAGAGGSVASGGSGAGATGGSGAGAPAGGAGAGGNGNAGAGASGGSAGVGGSTAGVGGAGGSGMAGAAAGGAGAAGAPTAGCIVPATADAEPMLLSQTGCVDPTAPTKAAASLIPYDVNSPLWSDGAAKERYVFLPPGTKVHVKDCAVEPATCMPIDSGGSGEDEGHWDLPVGTVLMNVFAVGGKRIETRLLMHRAETTWQGYSFEWNDAETDATLLPDLKDKVVGDQTWHYPSRSQCLECHTKAGGRSLGLTTAQLNRDYAYADGTLNQLDKFEALGLFDATPTRIAGLPDPKGSADLELRARSYLQANCSLCHRPGGPVSDVDLRSTTAFKDTSLCNQMVNMGTGILPFRRSGSSRGAPWIP